MIVTTDISQAGEKGIRRIRSGQSFRYVDSRKNRVAKITIARIKALRIPPAWTDVWISPKPQSHLQATGRDARRRKQYLYHPQWNQMRELEKYRHMLEFVRALPALRRRVARDLSRPGLPKEKVLALIVRLLETTLIRVGNEEYAKTNHSYGLSTMRDHHVTIRGNKVSFHFLGKSKKKHHIEIADGKLSKIIKQCRDLPGEELFQYRLPDRSRHSVSSTDVNQYLKDISRLEITAKDFRTWAGTFQAAWALREFEDRESRTKIKRNISEAIKSVAEKLGNTPAICRSSYVHPYVLKSYGDGSLLQFLGRKTKKVKIRAGLRIEEQTVFLFLQTRRVSRAKKRAA